MSDWKVLYRDDHHRDATSTHTSKEAAIVQALHLERRQHCRIQIIEGQNGELIDRETFEREHLKKPPRYLRHTRLGTLSEGHAPRSVSEVTAAFSGRIDSL
jgi:hypothetical protein